MTADIAKASVAKADTLPIKAVQSAQIPAQIANDPTLRVGDAYMTLEGLRIYRGKSTKHHGKSAKTAQAKAFVDYRRSALGAGAKSKLAALDSGMHAAAGGRAIATITKLAPHNPQNRKSVDRHGRVIRVVGP
ncbi:MAG: hypothetical protein ACK5JM_01605 [Rhodoblastus sp.]